MSDFVRKAVGLCYLHSRLYYAHNFQNRKYRIVMNSVLPIWHHRIILLAVCFSIATPCSAAINDVFPADYTALPEGTNTATLYYFERTQTGPYSNGRNALNWQIHSSIAALRLTRSMKFAGMTVSPLLVVPYSDSSISGAGIPATIQRSTAGMADSRVGAALWFYNDAGLRRYLAVNATLVMPTGSYDTNPNVALNPGENRYRRVLSLGWIHGFGDNVTLDATPEIAWYGDNPNYQGSRRLEQAPTYAFTGYLRYQLTPDWRAFAGYQANRGGKTRVNGIAQNNAINSDRMYLGGTYRYKPSVFVDFRYAQGLNFVNGFVIRDELALRINKLF